MNEHVSEILSGIAEHEYREIAGAIVGAPTAVSVVGKPEFRELTGSHNDQRTLGIVRVSGIADYNSARIPWSAVVKVADMDGKASSGHAEAAVYNEHQIYQQNLLNTPEVPLRPAKCYRSDSIDERFRVFWLEDLTGAPQPPWDPAHFVRAASHLGQFAGYHIKQQTRLPFDIDSDWYLSRRTPEQMKSNAADLLKERDSELARQAYAGVPIESAPQLAELSARVLEAGKSVQHCLSYGDSHSRNMFPVGPTTVGIDWGFVCNEPVGADVGVLIGSALTYTVSEAQLIAAHEREIYESYLSGLGSSGWEGNESEVRIGFFCQFLGYLTSVSAIPITLRTYESRREFIEGRFGVPFDDIPKHLAPVIELIPGYIHELEDLQADI